MTVPRGERLAALVAAGVTVLTTAGPGLLPVVVATGGLVVFALGLVRARRSWLSAGALCLFGGVAVAAVAGGGPPAVLVGGAATMVAWDAAERAVNLGEHVGAAGVTRRSRAAHAGGTLAVAGVGVLAGYVTLTAGPGSLPLVALVSLCLAVVLLVVVLGD